MAQQTFGQQGRQRPQDTAQGHVGGGLELHGSLPQQAHRRQQALLGASRRAAQRGRLIFRPPLALRAGQGLGPKVFFLARSRRRPARIAL